MNNAGYTFENIYDTYSPMLYGIALQISPTRKQAEQILIVTFQKAHHQNIIHQNPLTICASLIKLTIQTAHHQLKTKNNFTLKQFQTTPLLHKLLCGQITFQDHCTQNKITCTEAAKQLREEMVSLRKPEINESETQALFNQ